jgi:hypothetical protein
MKIRTFKIVCFGAVVEIIDARAVTEIIDARAVTEIIDARAVTVLDYKNPICFQINWLGSVLQRSFDLVIPF